jgi:hypothetical protein
MSVHFLRRLVLLKPGHGRGLILLQIALWIDRRLPAIGRGESQLDAGVSENEVGAAPSSSQKPVLRPVLVMRRKHHQDFHVSSPYSSLELSDRFETVTPQN